MSGEMCVYYGTYQLPYGYQYMTGFTGGLIDQEHFSLMFQTSMPVPFFHGFYPFG